MCAATCNGCSRSAIAASSNATTWENDMSAPKPPAVPLLAELAPLPRQQVGPFLILGVEKDASHDDIEAGWAQKLIKARRNLIATTLEDINWARETVNDPQRRHQADALTLNVDTTDGTLRRLRNPHQPGSSCQPLDVEKDLSGYCPTTPVPSAEELRRAITLAEI